MSSRFCRTLAILFLCVDVARSAEHTNVVVFLADDLGWGDLACFGHPVIKTPNLDRFAADGMRFTQCYSASSVCSPSRSSILTGRTPYRNGVYSWIPAGRDLHLRSSEISIARLVKERGYETCHVGKWHLNGKFNSPAQPQPNDHGYDWWFATQNNAAPSHKNPRNFVRNGEPVGAMVGFSASLVAAEAIQWLEKRRERSKPFYLAVWTHEPHLPIESDPRFMKLYAPGEEGGSDEEEVRQHHGNVTQIDDAFGALMSTLDRLGLRDDTFVFFTSDNGPEGNGQRGRTRGSTGGLRGRKRALYEGGIRVPGIARWPGRIAPGSTCDQPVIGSDLFTTVCEIAGAPVPADRTIDGASLVPAFKRGAIARKLPLYWRYGGAPHGLKIAMRKGDWKILASESLDRFELYDIANDPKETRELSGAERDRFTSMRKTLLELNASIEAEGPTSWKTYFSRKSGRKKKSAAPPGKGVDETGEFDVVRGVKVSRADGGVLASAAGEGFALKRLPKVARKKLVVATSYRPRRSSGTRNAFLAFGDVSNHDKLLKVGTAIGLGKHAVFRGGWSNLGSIVKTASGLGEEAKIEVRVTIDLVAKRVVAQIGSDTITSALPEDLRQVSFYGLYVKQTESFFSPVRIVEAD